MPVRWLSAAHAITRVVRLFKVILSVLTEDAENPKNDQAKMLLSHFQNKDFQLKLAFLADLLTDFNKINCQLQGRGKTLKDVSLIYLKQALLKRKFT